LHGIEGYKEKRMEFLVDELDEPLVSSGRIRIRKNRRTYYVSIGSEFLHRLIIGAKPGEVVDHINGNGLDNRRSNLRICSVGQNRQRGVEFKRGASGYRGVHKRRDRWKAQIWHENKNIYLGTFISKQDAARAYDAKAKELFGDLALTNF